MTVLVVPAISVAFRRVLRNSVTQLLPNVYKANGTDKAIEVRIGAIGGESSR